MRAGPGRLFTAPSGARSRVWPRRAVPAPAPLTATGLAETTESRVKRAPLTVDELARVPSGTQQDDGAGRPLCLERRRSYQGFGQHIAAPTASAPRSTAASTAIAEDERGCAGERGTAGEDGGAREQRSGERRRQRRQRARRRYPAAHASSSVQKDSSTRKLAE